MPALGTTNSTAGSAARGYAKRGPTIASAAWPRTGESATKGRWVP